MGTWECSEGKGEGKGQAKLDPGALLSRQWKQEGRFLTTCSFPVPRIIHAASPEPAISLKVLGWQARPLLSTRSPIPPSMY